VIRHFGEALVSTCQNCYKWVLPLSPFSSGRSSAECLGQGVLVHSQSGAAWLSRTACWSWVQAHGVYSLFLFSYLVLMLKGDVRENFVGRVDLMG
jgi:hypothetical protein